MARPLRIEFPGAIYHVSSRMMSNHFHLVLETPQGNLSRFMQNLTTAYTVYYNLRHQRHGHVLDGRFKSKLVSGDEYLLRLSRYVHQNPVWVGAWAKKPIKERIAHLHAYPWSSYPSYIGRRKPLKFVDDAPLLKMVDEISGGGRSGYRRYVDSGLAEVDAEFKEALKASPCCVGGAEFRLWVEGLRSQGLSRRKVKEDVALRRVVAPLKPQLVLEVLARVFKVKPDAFQQRRKNPGLREAAARCLIRFSGQTQREAAVQLGLGTGAAVSVQLRRLRGLLERDRSLRRSLDRAQNELERLRQQESSPERGK